MKNKLTSIKTAFIICISLLIITACQQQTNRGNLVPRKNTYTIKNNTAVADEYSALRQIITFDTDTTLSAFVEYWETDHNNMLFRSDTSTLLTHHKIKLCKLKPETNYSYRLIVFNSRYYSESGIFKFTSNYIPTWLDEYYTPKKNVVHIPGKLFIYKRKSPGVMVLLNNEGEIEWYNVFNSFIKTACYTNQGTFLAVLSDPGYKTAYGNHIVEINLKGDTLAHFKTGTQNFDRIFHHEVLLDKNGNIVTLTVKNIKTEY